MESQVTVGQWVHLAIDHPPNVINRTKPCEEVLPTIQIGMVFINITFKFLPPSDLPLIDSSPRVAPAKFTPKT